MKNKTDPLMLLVIITIIALIWLSHALLPPPKARAQRIRVVNSLASTFPKTIVLTNVYITEESYPIPAR